MTTRMLPSDLATVWLRATAAFLGRTWSRPRVRRVTSLNDTAFRLFETRWFAVDFFSPSLYRISSISIFRFCSMFATFTWPAEKPSLPNSNAEKAPLACWAPNPHHASTLPRPNQVYGPGPEPLRTPFPICHPFENLTQLNIIPIATEWRTIDLSVWNVGIAESRTTI